MTFWEVQIWRSEDSIYPWNKKNKEHLTSICYTERAKTKREGWEVATCCEGAGGGVGVKYSDNKIGPSSSFLILVPLYRRKIGLIEGNAKCRHLKKNWPVNGLCSRCLSVWGPVPQATPSHTVLYTCIQDTYSHSEGGKEKVEPERRIEGQQFTKLSRKYQHDFLHLLLWCLHS